MNAPATSQQFLDAWRHTRHMADSLLNLVTGLGTAQDKSVHTQWTFVPLTRQDVEFAYRGDWVAAKVVDIPAKDATREWRNWKATDDQIEVLEDAEKGLQLQQRMTRALTLSRLYGGAALVLGIDGPQQDPAQELDVEQLGEGQLKFVHAVSCLDLKAGELEADLRSAYYGQPKYYERQAMPGEARTGALRFHPSRVVRLIGRELPDTNTVNNVMGGVGWGDPVLQAVDNAVRSAGMVSGGIAALIDEMKVDIIKIPGLTTTVATEEGRQAITNRIAYANTAKSIVRAYVLDKEEEWERIQLELAGMPELLKVYLMLAAGASDIPVTRFLGQSPTGLSATGEHDMENYYNGVSTHQTTVLQPVCSMLDEVLIRSALGDRPPEVHYEWAPLWQMSDEQKAKISYNKAQAFQIDANSGLIPDAVLGEARVNQLIEDGTYPGLDALMADFNYEMFLGSPEEQAQHEEALAQSALEPPPAAGQQPGPPPKPPPKLLPPPARDSLRRRLRDAQPRTLYVHRPVVNAGAIRTWAREAGFQGIEDAAEMHVTILYSRQPVDWMAMGSAWSSDERGRTRVPPGGPRMLDRLRDAVVLLFSSTDLQWRHREMIERGASHDYPEYAPHITITREHDGADLLKIAPYQGEIILGPEVFQEIDDNDA